MNSANVIFPDRSNLRRALVAVELLGPIAVILVGWASTSVRDTMAIANVALVMAAITVGVAIIGWRGGLATSVAAALSLNYFHTEPVHTLRITDKSDLVAVLLLGTLGIAVSAATAVRVRAAARAHHKVIGLEGRTEIAASMQTSRPVTQVWADSVRASCGELALVDCKVEPIAPTALPAIARYRPSSDEAMSSFVLAESGAVIPFVNRELPGVVVLTPQRGMGAVTLDRRIVTNFVENLEAVLSKATPTRRPD
jgi:hypothetical protein